MDHIIYRVYIAKRRSFIYCSLASVCSPRSSIVLPLFAFLASSSPSRDPPSCTCTAQCMLDHIVLGARCLPFACLSGGYLCCVVWLLCGLCVCDDVTEFEPPRPAPPPPPCFLISVCLSPRKSFDPVAACEADHLVLVVFFLVVVERSNTHSPQYTHTHFQARTLRAHPPTSPLPRKKSYFSGRGGRLSGC